MTPEEQAKLPEAVESMAKALAEAGQREETWRGRAEAAAAREAGATEATRARHFALADADLDARRALAVATLAAAIMQQDGDDAEIAVERAHDLLFPSAHVVPDAVLAQGPAATEAWHKAHPEGEKP